MRPVSFQPDAVQGGIATAHAAVAQRKAGGKRIYADGQFDDARFGLSLAQTFAQQGGELINYAKAVGFDKDSNGKLAVAEVEDQLTDERFQIRAKVFVNCTGPFADHIRLMANPAVPERLRLSKGVHLLLPLGGDPERICAADPEDGGWSCDLCHSVVGPSAGRYHG